MPATTVIKCTCERCGRVWLEENGDEPHETATLELTFTSPKVNIAQEFGVLCESCTNAVSALVQAIFRDFKKASPKRRAKKGAEAPRVSPPPPPPRSAP